MRAQRKAPYHSAAPRLSAGRGTLGPQRNASKGKIPRTFLKYIFVYKNGIYSGYIINPPPCPRLKTRKPVRSTGLSPSRQQPWSTPHPPPLYGPPPIWALKEKRGRGERSGEGDSCWIRAKARESSFGGTPRGDTLWRSGTSR